MLEAELNTPECQPVADKAEDVTQDEVPIAVAECGGLPVDDTRVADPVEGTALQDRSLNL